MFLQILSSNEARKRDKEFFCEVYYQLGLTYHKMQDDSKTEESFKNSISIASSAFSSYQARINLARLYYTTGNPQQGIELLNEVIQDRSDELAAEGQKVLGDVNFEMKEYDKALANYLRVKYVYNAYNYWVAIALYHAGLSYEQMNQFEGARKVYEEIIDKYPTEKIAQKAKERLASL